MHDVYSEVRPIVAHPQVPLHNIVAYIRFWATVVAPLHLIIYAA